MAHFVPELDNEFLARKAAILVVASGCKDQTQQGLKVGNFGSLALCIIQPIGHECGEGCHALDLHLQLVGTITIIIKVPENGRKPKDLFKVW